MAITDKVNFPKDVTEVICIAIVVAFRVEREANVGGSLRHTLV